MKLKTKTLLTVALTLAGLISVLYTVSSTILLGSLAQAEKESSHQTVEGVLNIFTQNQENFSSRYDDWSAWDDTYTFINDGNKRYIESNLVPAQLANLKVNLVLFINKSGQQIFGTTFNISERKLQPVPQDFNQHLTPNSLLVKHQNSNSQLNGILIVNQMPMLITSKPILTSEGLGPIRGTLIFGRYLDQDNIKKLSQISRLPLTIQNYNDPQMASDFQTARSFLSQEKSIWVQPLNQETMGGYALLKDIYGQPALLLRVDIPRTTYQQAKTSQLYLIISLVIVGIVFTGVTLLLLERLVLRRLINLSREVKNIGTTGDLSRRISVVGKDELSSLSESINWMLLTLENLLKDLRSEREKSERLLLNILPSPIADRLKQEESNIADSFGEVTVLFADIVGFTKLSARISPQELVDLLNHIFSMFDKLAEIHQLEKIKTIGDAYMVAAGIPHHRVDHAEAIADMALDMLQALKQFNKETNQDFNIRIGVNTGPVIAGVIGTKKFIYDLWGDTVNIASRMESQGIPGYVQVTENTYDILKEKYLFRERGLIHIKGKGDMLTYLLMGKKLVELMKIS
ncbi:HAMP domain-containing protein [Phormidium sp. LEGE 05292]|uniref:adenylate/guanylate cyclase domain-containing protein n=1 Tax=[Phormidium] sp. LEGE 05292 TaxID=767427 RepID=UPI00187FB1FF|nr:adenylate/guanylate cyclase domain-containing protein [Phormidium sp. LEGE 05292]MBE9224421.1 HAMP domain-containing protein [Phormidium sp. LEGE 05292]